MIPRTNHRFSDREQILEEIVDVYLTNISIAHSLGFTDEEMTDMLNKKSKKWAELQLKEEAATFPSGIIYSFTIYLFIFNV